MTPTSTLAQATMLTYELSLDSTTLSASHVGVRFSLHNPTAEVAYVNPLQTPFAEPAGRPFEVVCGGESVSYVGRMIKRAPAHPDEFLRIDPGGSRSTEVDLAQSYEFSGGSECELSFDAGRVEVRWAVPDRPDQARPSADAARGVGSGEPLRFRLPTP
ncbi:hypothetical protein RDV64_08980 [Acuticoccus sp. MNP-M23]|uniref:hypothetical protein n=1 Tax=Acuticoccus sp. MNP-M23 TaxID=3072793 RepID=UPI002816702B|nr:hypothetical protein [Acuticoccus sp. MNP-M23]WMS44504.1 hypothetical protein RDV64_08980 [Acuticoccus sp. MNP-M23]